MTGALPIYYERRVQFDDYDGACAFCMELGLAGVRSEVVSLGVSGPYRVQYRYTGSEAGKIQEQLNTKYMTPFTEQLKAYLDGRAAEDALFAKSYAKPNKSLEEC